MHQVNPERMALWVTLAVVILSLMAAAFEVAL